MTTWYDAGRRIGLHTAIAQLTARKQQLFEIYNAAQIERICDIYDIKYHETEACLAIVQQILEAKMDDTYQGPTANQPKKCPLPRIGSKDWGWESHSTISLYGVSRPTHKSALTRYSVYEGVNYCTVLDPSMGGRARRIGSKLSLRDAKTLAEARARRDWRRENRWKK